MDLETKNREAREIARFLRQIRDIQRPFTAIENLYFREEIDTLDVRVMSDGG